MGAVILGAAAVANPAHGGSIGHLTAAGLRCMGERWTVADHVDLVINSGLYRDGNLAEPAIAAIVQHRMGINTDYAGGAQGRATLSFDLMNSVCGPINAIGAAAAFLAPGGGMEQALLLCGDAHPSGATEPEYPYTTVGAALLLGRGVDPDYGFGRVATLMAPADSPGAEGYIDLGRGVDLIVRADRNYGRRAATLAADLVRTYAADEGLDLARVLIVSPEVTVGFGAMLATALQVNPAQVAIPQQRHGSPHTAGLYLAYMDACATGKAARFQQMLFVAAGAGVTAACVSYRPALRCSYVT